MNKTLGAVCALLLVLVVGMMVEMPTSATEAIQSSFTDRYGPTLTDRYSCGLCHPAGSFTEFNSYGEDLLDAIAATGSCNEFFPPNTHTLSFGRCEYLHAPGLNTPYTSKCTYCHGADLDGLIAPSCFQCHGQRWDEAGPVPAANTAKPTLGITALDDAFAAIEQMDSDGDGYSNIDEINGGSHPGDATSFPGGEPEMTVTLPTTWNREWTDSRKTITVTLTPQGATTIDATVPVVIKNGARSLTLTNLKLNGKVVQAIAPQALLYTLFKDLDVAKASIIVAAVTEFDEDLQNTVEISLTGDAPAFIKGLKLSFDSKTWKSGTDVAVTIKGDTKGLINDAKAVFVAGPFGTVKLGDIARNGSTITGVIDGDDIEKLVGEPVEGVVYVIGLYGETTDKAFTFAVNSAVKAEAGSNCYKFDAPSSHNIALKQGECTYMHAPGMSTPFASKCNACHGSDLKGSSFAPSCFLCHGQNWTAAPPQTTVKR